MYLTLSIVNGVSPLLMFLNNLSKYNRTIDTNTKLIIAKAKAVSDKTYTYLRKQTESEIFKSSKKVPCDKGEI